jgi:hypothetical protein
LAFAPLKTIEDTKSLHAYRRRRILGWLLLFRFSSAEHLAAICGLSKRSAEKLLKQLEADQAILIFWNRMIRCHLYIAGPKAKKFAPKLKFLENNLRPENFEAYSYTSHDLAMQTAAISLLNEIEEVAELEVRFWKNPKLLNPDFVLYTQGRKYFCEYELSLKARAAAKNKLAFPMAEMKDKDHLIVWCDSDRVENQYQSIFADTEWIGAEGSDGEFPLLNLPANDPLRQRVSIRRLRCDEPPPILMSARNQTREKS